ncbi:MAG: hypothetical protein ACOX3Q_01730 [Clostridia bacterium]|jgi:hypothetical protein
MGIGKTFKAVSATCPEAVGGHRFERTLLLSDISSKDCYIIDVFRTEEGSGGNRDRYGCIINIQTDTSIKEQWHVTWEIDDSYYQMHHGDLPVYLEYTDVSGPSTVILCESWVDLWRDKKDSKGTDRMGDWIPMLITRKTGPEGLSSVCVSVIEPYEGRTNIFSVKRYSATDFNGTDSESNVAIVILLENGLKVFIVFTDQEPENRQDDQNIFGFLNGITMKNLKVKCYH